MSERVELGFPEEEFAEGRENEIVARFQPAMEFPQSVDGLRRGKAVATA